jgi:hypothetical protein
MSILKIVTNMDFQKVKNFIQNYRNNNIKVNTLLTRLESFGELILIGGAIRDIALLNRMPRDFDIIINSLESDFDKAFDGYTMIRNRFGGYKVIIEDMQFDIWSIQSHWAFKLNLISTNVENIKNTIFFNVDSLFLNLNNNFSESEYFNQAVINQELDIIMLPELRAHQLYKPLSVVRSFILQEKYKLKFSYLLEEFIDNWYRDKLNSTKILEEVHLSHYGFYKKFSK